MARKPTYVKIFRHDDIGAPNLTGAAGSVQALLHACLVTGYNIQTPSSITRDGAVVTVTYAAGHNYRLHQVLTISGCDQADYNGNHRIQSVTSKTLTIELPVGVQPPTPATGMTIETKVAPAGWARTHVSGDGLRAVYKSQAPDALGFSLYADDSNIATYRTAVKGYELVTDIDTRQGPFPYNDTDTMWCYWYKSADATTNRKWMLAADDKLFWFWLDYNNAGQGRMYGFGDVISFIPGDANHCIVSGSPSATNVLWVGGLLTVTDPMLELLGSHFARDAYGAIPGQWFQAVGMPTIEHPTSYAQDLNNRFPRCCGADVLSYPGPSSQLIIMPINCIEYDGTNVNLRGMLPGLQAVWNGGSVVDLELYETYGSDDSRVYMAQLVWASKSYISDFSHTYGPRPGHVAIDIIGPWR